MDGSLASRLGPREVAMGSAVGTSPMGMGVAVAASTKGAVGVTSMELETGVRPC